MTTMPEFQILCALANVDIGDFANKPTALVAGQQEASRPIWQSPDGTLEIGLWECTPGRFAADRSKSSEFCFFLSGRIVMTEQDGTRRTLSAGDSLMLPQGWKGQWDIAEHTRKIYVIQTVKA